MSLSIVLAKTEERAIGLYELESEASMPNFKKRIIISVKHEGDITCIINSIKLRIIFIVPKDSVIKE